MELQRGCCTICSTNTKVVVPPQASSITSVIKTVLAEQINVKEFASVNPALRVCPLCLQNLLTVKMLSKKLQRFMSPDSDNCCLCDEDRHLVLLKDHVYLDFLLGGTRYEETVTDCLMCLDCIKCLELMRTIKTNIVKKFPQLAHSSSPMERKAVAKSRVSKKSKKSELQIFLPHLKPLSRSKYNLQRFKRDVTLLHKICFVKLDDTNLNILKSNYKPDIEDRRSRRKCSTPKKDYIRLLSPSSRESTPSPPQNFFKIKIKQSDKMKQQEKRKHFSPTQKRSSKSKKRTSVSPIRKSGRDKTSRETFDYLDEKTLTARSRKTHRNSIVQDESFASSGKKMERPHRIGSQETRTESADDSKKLIVNVSRMSVDEDDEEILVVEERDPLAISDDENTEQNVLKTPTKASRKMMPDTNINSSGKKRKSVTFAVEKNVEIQYGNYGPTASIEENGTQSSVKKSSLKKSRSGGDSDDEEKLDFLEHVRNNVDDVFNALKSTEPGKTICQGIVNDIISEVIGSSDDENSCNKKERITDIEVKSANPECRKRRLSSGDSESDSEQSQAKKLKTSDDLMDHDKAAEEEMRTSSNADQELEDERTKSDSNKISNIPQSRDSQEVLEGESDDFNSNIEAEENLSPRNDESQVEKSLCETTAKDSNLDWKSDYESKDNNEHIEVKPEKSKELGGAANNDDENDSSKELGDDFQTVDSCGEDQEDEEITAHAEETPDESNSKQELENGELCSSVEKYNGNSDKTVETVGLLSQ